MILADTKSCRDTSSLLKTHLFTLVYLIFAAAYLIAFTPHTVHNFELKLQSCSTHVHIWRNWCCTWGHSYWVGGFKHLVRLRSCQKAMGSCTAQCKMLLLCANTIVRESAKFDLARLKKEEEEEKPFWRFGDFWCSTFATVFHDTRSLLGQGNTRRWIVSCHKGLFAAPLLKDFLY